jgi:chromate transport protein ChrA
MFIVFIIYQASSEPASPYSTIVGAITIVLGLVLPSFLVAGILTITYATIKRQKWECTQY